MTYFILGIIAGWLIPRPRFVSNVEHKLLSKYKEQIPEKFRWW